MKFFTNVKNADELKKAFKSLMMKHHPDRGGKNEDVIALRAEYDLLMSQFINGFDDSNYQKNDKGYSFWESKAEHTEVEKKVREAIEKIIMLDGIEIEIVGVWVWVSGDTKPHKEILKDAGFKFTMKKDATGEKKPFWFFAGKKSGGKGKTNIDDVRAKYGSTTVKKTTNKKALGHKRKSLTA